MDGRRRGRRSLSAAIEPLEQPNRPVDPVRDDAGARVKTIRSHLSSNDLTALAAAGGRPAGPPPLHQLVTHAHTVTLFDGRDG